MADDFQAGTEFSSRAVVAAESEIATLSVFELELGRFKAPSRLAGAPTPEVWVTQPGDHFWLIAQEVLAEGSPGTPSETQVATYWARLIDTNRHLLLDSSNADLIYPGQEFVLPPVQPR